MRGSDAFDDIRLRNMKSPLEAPEKQIAEETSAKAGSRRPVIDTSKMSAGKAAALDLAESSRDPLDERGSFASNLFIGRYDFDRIFPYPEQSAEDRAAGEAFLQSSRSYLRRQRRRRRDRSHRRNSAEEYRRPLRDGRVRHQNPEAIRRAWFVAGELWPRRDVARQLGREPDRARFRASIDRRSATAVAFRHGGTKEKISAARRAQGNLRLRAHGIARRLRSRRT